MSKIFNDSMVKKLLSFNYTIIYKSLKIKDDMVNFIVLRLYQCNGKIINKPIKVFTVQIHLEDFKNIINVILSDLQYKTFFYKRFNNHELLDYPIIIERIQTKNKYIKMNVNDKEENVKEKNDIENDDIKYEHLLFKTLGISGNTEISQYIYDHDFIYYSYCILQCYMSNILSIYIDFRDKFNNIIIREFNNKGDNERDEFWNNFDKSIKKAFEYLNCDILPLDEYTSVVNCELFVFNE